MALPCISWSLDVKPGRTLEVGHGGKLKANNGVCGYPGLKKTKPAAITVFSSQQ
jgi:hypothetical protein